MAKLSEKLAAMPPKTRQYLMLGGAGVVIMGLIFASVALMDGQPDIVATAKTPNTEQQSTSITAPGAAADPKDIWMTQSSAQMKQMEDVIKGLQDQMNAQSGTPATSTAAEPILPPLPPVPPMQPAASPLPQTGQIADPNIQAIEPPPEPRESGIASFEVSIQESKPEATPPEARAGYIPAGSFVRVALLGGLDAPTGGQAQTNPHPILMRTQDNAFLPNRYRYAIKECFILASSYGDISSERAFGRLENLSCVKRDGSAVDIPVKGYVVGEDGKAGMRGRLISKQGQILANALLAGIGSGIGQAFQNSSTTQSISALGTTSTVNPGQQLQNGIGVGVGKTLDRLSKYYIDLAEKLFPIIEIDAGRTVEVVFTKGFSLDDINTVSDGKYSDVWTRGRRVMGKALDPNAEQ